MYLLDTSIVVALLENRPPSTRNRLRRAQDAGTPVAISAVVYYELWYGVAKSNRPRDTAEALRVFLAGLAEVLAFDEGDARMAGDVRATLERSGRPIGGYDLLIAGQALNRDAILVTANTREFPRVPGLHWEDWTV